LQTGLPGWPVNFYLIPGWITNENIDLNVFQLDLNFPSFCCHNIKKHYIKKEAKKQFPAYELLAELYIAVSNCPAL